MRFSRTVIVASLGLALAPSAFGKGLQEIGAQNPENDAEHGDGEGGGAAHASATNQAPSALSNSLKDKLFLATGFGWVRATKGEGEWESSGMSDVSVGYQVAKINGQMGLAATYRYAPMAVTGKVDGHQYRGIWESHNAGALVNYKLAGGITAIGSAELGFVIASLTSVDGLPELEKNSENGASFTVGGGADWQIGDKEGFAVGPRLYLGAGSYSSVQLGAGARFLF